MFICRWCKRNDFSILWDLGSAPSGDFFQNTLAQSKAVNKMPLVLVECQACKLMQLKDNIDINRQYNNYLYKTSATFGLTKMYSNIAEYLLKRYLPTNPKVIDIGSNDGSFLSYFNKKVLWILGIEPGISVAEYANSIGIKTLNTYFSKKIVENELTNINEQIDLVSVNYVLANVEDLSDFLHGVVLLLKPGGILSIITGYHPDQFNVAMFEYINHDHLIYFNIENLISILNSFNLTVIEVRKNELKGGSIHLIAKKERNNGLNFEVDYLIQRENWLWQNNVSGVSRLKSRIYEVKKVVKNELGRRGAYFAGVGASISTTYLVNQFEISEFIDYLIDDDKSKIGKFSPYFGKEVISFENAKNSIKQQFIILAWQHSNKLLTRLKENSLHGAIFVPLPNPNWINV